MDDPHFRCSIRNGHCEWGIPSRKLACLLNRRNSEGQRSINYSGRERFLGGLWSKFDKVNGKSYRKFLGPSIQWTPPRGCISDRLLRISRNCACLLRFGFLLRILRKSEAVIRILVLFWWCCVYLWRKVAVYLIISYSVTGENLNNCCAEIIEKRKTVIIFYGDITQDFISSYMLGGEKKRSNLLLKIYQKFKNFLYHTIVCNST